MTRPADITVLDEIKSLQMYLSVMFPSDEIRRARPEEGDEYTMLITQPNISVTHHNNFMSTKVIGLNIQRWCDDFDEALEYQNDFEILFTKGIAPGKKAAVPVWVYDDNDPPIPNPIPDPPNEDIPATEVERFMRVGAFEVNILPSEDRLKYVVVCEVILHAVRVIHTYEDQLIEQIDIGYEA
jgi:hypothetical protein